MHLDTSQTKPITVSELTDQIKSVLEGAFPRVWVEGELSNLNLHRSGHVYLSLKDSDSRIDGVIWRSTAQRLQYRPNTGDKILVRGRLNVYAPQGSYKLIVESIEPAGMGALQAAFEALKVRLNSEGLFSHERKNALPLLPRAVGVITSATGAARRDIESVIHRRSPQIPIILYPAIVQGRSAAPDIVRGLRILAEHPLVDVLIVGRGGGSMEDLWAFNEEVVVRAIADCSKPVISAVGHETDTTIADLVADKRAPTPSAAAELAVPVRDDLLYTVDMLAERLTRSLEHHLDARQALLARLSLRLNTVLSPGQLRRPIDVFLRQLDSGLRRIVNQERGRLARLDNALREFSPVGRLSRARGCLTELRGQLSGHAVRRVSMARSRFAQAVGRLEALSPLASLDRGLSITLSKGTLIRSHRQLSISDPVTVLLADGSFDARVTKIHEEHDLSTKDDE